MWILKNFLSTLSREAEIVVSIVVQNELIAYFGGNSHVALSVPLPSSLSPYPSIQMKIKEQD